MTVALWVAIAAVVVSLLTVLAAVWGRLVQHGESRETLDTTRDANELHRYETLQEDVRLARDAAEEARTENAVLRGRIVALEAAADERERELNRMSRRIETLTAALEAQGRLARGGSPTP